MGRCGLVYSPQEPLPIPTNSPHRPTHQSSRSRISCRFSPSPQSLWSFVAPPLPVVEKIDPFVLGTRLFSLISAGPFSVTSNLSYSIQLRPISFSALAASKPFAAWRTQLKFQLRETLWKESDAGDSFSASLPSNKCTHCQIALFASGETAFPFLFSHAAIPRRCGEGGGDF